MIKGFYTKPWYTKGFFGIPFIPKPCKTKLGEGAEWRCADLGELLNTASILGVDFFLFLPVSRDIPIERKLHILYIPP